MSGCFFERFYNIKEIAMKKLMLVLLALACFTVGTAALAALSGAGSVANQISSNLAAIAKLITAIAYVAGMACAIAAVVKFKAHKDNPTQIPIGTPIALLFVAAALLFIPSVFKVGGATLFGSGGKQAGISGVKSF
jgi:heme/copper-type cytochrome/quinol oxidase subunit 2